MTQNEGKLPHIPSARRHSGSSRIRPAGWAMLVPALVVACHGSGAGTLPYPVEVSPPTGTTTLDKVAVIEAEGVAIPDTSVTFATARGRTIMIRGAPPDDAIFAVLQFPALTDSLQTRDSIRITIRPVRGLYEFTLTAPDSLPEGGTATFSYAIHFHAPASVQQKYPDPGRLELVIGPAELVDSNTVHFLDGTRPASDMIRFPIAHPGTYLLGVPK